MALSSFSSAWTSTGTRSTANMLANAPGRIMASPLSSSVFGSAPLPRKKHYDACHSGNHGNHHSAVMDGAEPRGAPGHAIRHYASALGASADRQTLLAAAGCLGAYARWTSRQSLPCYLGSSARFRRARLVVLARPYYRHV